VVGKLGSGRCVVHEHKVNNIPDRTDNRIPTI
jgi:hypothetical protein